MRRFAASAAAAAGTSGLRPNEGVMRRRPRGGSSDAAGLSSFLRLAVPPLPRPAAAGLRRWRRLGRRPVERLARHLADRDNTLDAMVAAATVGCGDDGADEPVIA
jgi:hypothetical protein